MGRGPTPEYQRERRARMRQALIMLLGGRCQRCGINDMRVLQLDHVNGGGRAERRARGYSGRGHADHMRAIASVLNDEGVFQLLCANCNWIKRSERGEQPLGERR